MMESAEYEEFRRDAFERLWQDVAPLEAEIEDSESIPREKLWPALEKMGAFGWLIPEACGGHGLTVRQYLPLIAEVSKVHGGIRALVHVHNSIGHALYE